MTQRNRHFAIAYLLGTTSLSFIRLTELEPSIYPTKQATNHKQNSVLARLQFKPFLITNSQAKCWLTFSFLFLYCIFDTLKSKNLKI